MQEKGPDLSYQDTVSCLTPMTQREIRTRAYKPSLLPMGSSRNPILRPSKLIEHSRAYMAGDPLQSIDWRTFAKTEQLMIRQIKDESMAKVTILVDLGPTMQWPNPNLTVINEQERMRAPKSEIAIRLALYLAATHKNLGNSVEFWVLENEGQENPRFFLPMQTGSGVLQIFHLLEKEKFSLQAFLALCLEKTFENKVHFDIAYWIGDCLGNTEFKAFLGQSKLGQLFHVLSSLETNPDWILPEISYFDEAQGVKEFQGKILRNHDFYLTELKAWSARLEKSALANGAKYHLVNDQTRIDSFFAMTSDFGEISSFAPGRTGGLGGEKRGGP